MGIMDKIKSLFPARKVQRNDELVLEGSLSVTMPCEIEAQIVVEKDDSKIDYAIMTVSRQPEYIHDTLASMDADYSIRLVVGSPDSDYLNRYRSNHMIEIVEADLGQWEQIKDKIVNHRASWNYWRSLVLGGEGNNGIAVFEDDVKFAAGWKEYLERTVRELNVMGDNYILALYACYPFIRTTYQNGGRWVDYPIGGFYGTQGMYFTDRTRKGYAEFIKKYGVDSFNLPYDLLMKDYVRQNNVKFLAIAPCLVQHMGVQTTGLGNHHMTNGYVESVR